MSEILNCLYFIVHFAVKEKAEVLIEVDRLQMMRDELSSEVSSLHAQLEQERSKVHALTAENKNKSQVRLNHLS